MFKKSLAALSAMLLSAGAFASSLRYDGISEEQRVLDMENAMRENNLMWYYCDRYVRPSFSYDKAPARGIVFKSETDFLVFRLRYS